MATIKKKDLKKYEPKRELDEISIGDVELEGGGFEDTDGSLSNSTSEISAGPHIKSAAGKRSKAIDTDTVEKDKMQHLKYNTGMGTSVYANTAIARENTINDKKKLDEVAKNMMRKIVEDMLTNKSKTNSGMVNKTNDSIITGKSEKSNDTSMDSKPNTPDVNNDNIPDIKELNNKAITSNSINFINFITNTEIQGDERGIILNYILSNIDLSDISPNYKSILIKRING
jgi:hypothetical protein